MDYSEQGKKNRQSGQRFEAKVRQNLEELGYIVDKWTNSVDYNKNSGLYKVIPAKRKFNPYKKIMVVGTGFPDFICIKNIKGIFEVLGVEVKGNGYLDQKEKGMCFWLLENKIFSRILIAKKGKKRGEIEYDDYWEKYGKKHNKT